MLWGRFEDAQLERLTDVINQERPDTLILNGDTVDLFFGIKDGRRIANIESILRANHRIVARLRTIPNLYIVPGAHDQILRWDARARDILQSHLPNCKGVDDALVDPKSGIVVVSGSQWYYDNVVETQECWLSLTKDLTDAFATFMLSGSLDALALERLYVDGRLGFWYRSGNHYEFLKGMAEIFSCRIDAYFERMASIFQSPYFKAWVEVQFYEEHRLVGHFATLLAQDGGPELESIASVYWRTLGKTIRERLHNYLGKGTLDYPPYAEIPFHTAIVGHTHFSQTYKHHSGRSILFSGSTKPQTQVIVPLGVARNEFGGGYVRIEGGVAELVKFEKHSWSTDMRSLVIEDV